MDFYILSFIYKANRIVKFFIANIRKLLELSHEKLLFSIVRYRYVAILSFIFSLQHYFDKTQRDTRKRKGEILGFKDWRSELYFDKLKEYYLSLYSADDDILLDWLDKCAQKLHLEIKKSSDKPVVLMPMHFFSDEFAILISAIATEKRVDVFSDGSNTNWGDKWAKHLVYCNRENTDNNPIDNLNLYNVFESDSAESARKSITLLKDLKKNKSILAIFLDALPAYTAKFNKKQKLHRTILFKKIALLHKGVFSFPNIADSNVIPYYIYIDKGEIKIKVYNSIYSKDELYEEKIMKTFEISLIKHHQQWMLWHFPFFFNYNG